MAESLGVEGRGKFYEESGTIRDVIQNHMLQLVGFLAMESPTATDHESTPCDGERGVGHPQTGSAQYTVPRPDELRALPLEPEMVIAIGALIERPREPLIGYPMELRVINHRRGDEIDA